MSPSDDSEFDVPVADKEIQTTEFSPAHGKMDLLTVLMRELGAIYLQGKEPPDQLRPLMESTLSTSVRRLPKIGPDRISKLASPKKDMVVNRPPAGRSFISGGGSGKPVIPARRMRRLPSAFPSPVAYAMPDLRLETMSSPAAFVDTVNLSVGALPAGKSIVITFNATINNPFPAGVCQVSNFATVSGSNFSSVQTNTVTRAVETPPTIAAAAALSRQQGSAASTLQIATVNDCNQTENTLTAPVTPLTGSGVTIGSPSVDAAGNVTASVSASCTATNSTFTLTVTDAQNNTATSTLTVNVTANTPPAIGTYPNTSVTSSGSTTVTPSVAPSDNGSVVSLTASAPGFAGTLTGNPATGVISVGSANPPGGYTVTVTATDNCGATSTRTFQLTVGAACSVTVNPATVKQPYVAVPYIQILTASPHHPAGYTFSVSAGALPPGLQLVTVLGVTSIAGIPQTPGTYNFTIKAGKNGTTCEGTRSYTVTIPTTVVPILECVQRNQNGSYTARFGYNNSTGAAVTIPVGNNNYFTPGNRNRGQTTVFQPGRVVNAFSVTFNPNGNNLAVWFLKGPDGMLRPVSVLTTSVGCP